MEKLSIFCNTRLTNRYPSKIRRIDYHDFSRRKVTLLSVRKLLAYHAGLFFNSSPFEKVLAFLLKLSSFGNLKIIFFDELLQRPESIRDIILLLPKIICLRCVDLFLCVHKDVTGFKKIFRIPSEKIEYIPFKANNFEIIDELKTTDQHFVLSCGASHRDYDTFLHAMQLNPSVPATIVLPDQRIATYHKTRLNKKELPANVKILRHDFNKSTWNQIIAKSTFVVLPIKENVIQAAGISVALEAMLLGKPVIITKGPACNGILEDIAYIVKPGDPYELSNAIRFLWKDKTLRESMGMRGREFAKRLGGEDRLVRDILSYVIKVCQKSQ